jgi:hypothetical protein
MLLSCLTLRDLSMLSMHLKLLGLKLSVVVDDAESCFFRLTSANLFQSERVLPPVILLLGTCRSSHGRVISGSFVREDLSRNWQGALFEGPFSNPGMRLFGRPNKIPNAKSEFGR